MFLIPTEVRDNPWVQFLGLLLLLTVFLGFTFWIRDVLLPFFLAFIIAYMLDPLADWFEETIALGRTFAVIVLLVIISIILTLFSYYLVTQAIDLVGELGKIANNPPDVGEWFDSITPEYIKHYIEGYFENLKPQELIQQGIQFVRDHMSGLVDTFTQGTSYLWFLATRTFGAVGVIINVTIVIIVSIYLLRDFDRIVANCHEMVPLHYREEIEEIFVEIDELMRAFFRGYLIVCVTSGILYGIGYELLGLDGGFLIGMLTGFLIIVPYLGPAIGGLAAIGMSLYQFGPSAWAVGILLVFVAVQSLEGNILTPNIVGEAVGLNPVVVLFALMVFGKLLGFLGLLLAIPLAAIIKVLLGRAYREYRQSELFHGPEHAD